MQTSVSSPDFFLPADLVARALASLGETCDGDGCSECDGSELTEDEIAEMIGDTAVQDAWQEHEAEQRLWARIADVRKCCLEAA